jgi:hypothetical protein
MHFYNNFLKIHSQIHSHENVIFGQKDMQPLFNVMSLAHYIIFAPFLTTHYVAHFYPQKKLNLVNPIHIFFTSFH